MQRAIRLLFVIAVWVVSATGLTAQTGLEGFDPELPGEPQLMYKITVRVEPEEAGNASTQGYFAPGSTVTMNCSASSSRYRFEKWTRNGVDYKTTAKFSYTATAENVEMVAHFTDVDAISGIVTFSAEPAGSCTFSKTSGVKLEQGKSLTIAAQPAVSHVFKGWYRGETLVCAEKSYTLSMPVPCENIDLVAKTEFDPVLPGDPEAVTFYSIEATAEPAGSGSVMGAGSYQGGEKVTLTAVPANADWEFTGWSDGETKNPRKFDATENATFTAQFRSIAATYKTLTFKCVPKGACSFSRTSGELVTIGESVTLKAYPNSDFRFTGWYKGGVQVSDYATYEFAMPNEDLNLEARYEYEPQLPPDPEQDPSVLPDPPAVDPEPEPTPDPDPEPTPDPEPGPTPEPEPTPDPDPEPTPDPEPEPTPGPEPGPTPDPDPEPTPEPEPGPTPDPDPEPTPDPVEPANVNTIIFRKIAEGGSVVATEFICKGKIVVKVYSADRATLLAEQTIDRKGRVDVAPGDKVVDVKSGDGAKWIFKGLKY